MASNSNKTKELTTSSESIKSISSVEGSPILKRKPAKEDKILNEAVKFISKYLDKGNLKILKID